MRRSFHVWRTLDVQLCPNWCNSLRMYVWDIPSSQKTAERKQSGENYRKINSTLIITNLSSRTKTFPLWLSETSVMLIECDTFVISVSGWSDRSTKDIWGCHPRCCNGVLGDRIHAQLQHGRCHVGKIRQWQRTTGKIHAHNVYVHKRHLPRL